MKFPVVAEYPNHVWAYDFVFDWCENGRQLKFLTMVDEYTRNAWRSRWTIGWAPGRCGGVLERLMRERGVPAFVRSRTTARSSSPKYRTRMLAVKGVACTHIDPGSPWQNGKNERFNGIFRDECTNMETFHHRDHARAISRLFLRYYNTGAAALEPGLPDPGRVRAAAPPLGAGFVVLSSNVPSPAPNGGCRNVPVGESLPTRPRFIRYERYPCVRSLYIRVASGMGAGHR